MRPNLHLAFFIAVALAFLPDSCAHCSKSDGPNAAVPNWPQWRGPRQDGHSDDKRAPLVWGQGENLKWRIDLPGFGNSSPVVWQDRIFLTSATKTGTERSVLCIDRNSGKTLWQRTAAQGLPPEPVHDWNAHASATCATDGERVYAFFGTPGLVCYDCQGKLLWKKDFGPLVATNGWGAGAASPVLFEDLVFIKARAWRRCSTPFCGISLPTKSRRWPSRDDPGAKRSVATGIGATVGLIPGTSASVSSLSQFETVVTAAECRNIQENGPRHDVGGPVLDTAEGSTCIGDVLVRIAAVVHPVLVPNMAERVEVGRR